MLKLKDKLNIIEHTKQKKIKMHIYRLEYRENVQEKKMYSLGKCTTSYVKNNDSISLIETQFQTSLDNKRNFHHSHRILKIENNNNNQIQLRVQNLALIQEKTLELHTG